VTARRCVMHSALYTIDSCTYEIISHSARAVRAVTRSLPWLVTEQPALPVEAHGVRPSRSWSPLSGKRAHSPPHAAHPTSFRPTPAPPSTQSAACHRHTPPRRAYTREDSAHHGRLLRAGLRHDDGGGRGGGGLGVLGHVRRHRPRELLERILRARAYRALSGVVLHGFYTDGGRRFARTVGVSLH
jgi:hypothetical protein